MRIPLQARHATRVAAYQRASLTGSAASCWLGVRLQLLAAALLTAVALLATWTHLKLLRNGATPDDSPDAFASSRGGSDGGFDGGDWADLGGVGGGGSGLEQGPTDQPPSPSYWHTIIIIRTLWQWAQQALLGLAAAAGIGFGGGASGAGVAAAFAGLSLSYALPVLGVLEGLLSSSAEVGWCLPSLLYALFLLRL